MKIKGQVVTGDGFDRSVAEKMPKIRHQDTPLPSDLDEGVEPEPQIETPQAASPPEKQAEKRVIVPPFKDGVEAEQNLDVMGLIEDLHNQLLASSQMKRAMEIDLASSKRTVQQLAQDNRELRLQIEGLSKEFQKLKERETESGYLKEENEDALERIQELQQELKAIREALTQTLQEKEEALHRIGELESQKEQNEVLWIKGRLKEKEASHFSEENRDLRSTLEEALSKNLEIERKYEALKKSFKEVRESLSLLRDSCKSSYYNLSDTSG
jgi:chromosome segregation ATPase